MKKLKLRKSSICITGKLSSFTTKKAAAEEIIKRGGFFIKSVNESCSFLVVGSKGNANWSTAKKGININTRHALSLLEFLLHSQ